MIIWHVYNILNLAMALKECYTKEKRNTKEFYFLISIFKDKVSTWKWQSFDMKNHTKFDMDCFRLRGGRQNAVYQ